MAVVVSGRNWVGCVDVSVTRKRSTGWMKGFFDGLGRRPHTHTTIKTRTVLQDHVHERVPLLLLLLGLAAVLEEGLGADGEEARHEVEVLLHHVRVLLS